VTEGKDNPQGIPEAERLTAPRVLGTVCVIVRRRLCLCHFFQNEIDTLPAQFDAPRQWPLASKRISGASRNFLNAVANNRVYLERLQMAVEHLHKCKAVHSATVPVHEVFRGQTVSQGMLRFLT
jgi:hypothetical protein